MKKWYCIFLITFLVSCKSKAILVDSKPVTIIENQEGNKLTSDQIIQKHLSVYIT